MLRVYSLRFTQDVAFLQVYAVDKISGNMTLVSGEMTFGQLDRLPFRVYIVVPSLYCIAVYFRFNFLRFDLKSQMIQCPRLPLKFANVAQ